MRLWELETLVHIHYWSVGAGGTGSAGAWWGDASATFGAPSRRRSWMDNRSLNRLWAASSLTARHGHIKKLRINWVNGRLIHFNNWCDDVPECHIVLLVQKIILL